MYRRKSVRYTLTRADESVRTATFEQALASQDKYDLVAIWNGGRRAYMSMGMPDAVLGQQIMECLRDGAVIISRVTTVEAIEVNSIAVNSANTEQENN